MTHVLVNNEFFSLFTVFISDSRPDSQSTWVNLLIQFCLPRMGGLPCNATGVLLIKNHMQRLWKSNIKTKILKNLRERPVPLPWSKQKWNNSKI